MKNYCAEFEKFLSEQFVDIYIGPKGGVLEEGIVEAEERWIESLDHDDYISYAGRFARQCVDRAVESVEGARMLNDAIERAGGDQ